MVIGYWLLVIGGEGNEEMEEWVEWWMGVVSGEEGGDGASKNLL